MEQNKRFAFLITGCGDLLVVRGWGETREEAKNCLNLNSSYSVVEDVEIIQNFLAKEEAGLSNVTEHESKLMADYFQDLESIKNSLENKKEGMTIEQKLAYIKRALELGGDVNVKFHNIRDKKAAEQVAVELSEMSNRPYEQKSSNSTNWYKIQNEDYIFETYIFFDCEYLHEDVDLSGMKEGEEVC